ncbi:MAG: glyoxylate/hydroxypyruvate reductase A [Alphaproteobacteria bacterium]|nr:glyoxylate/hydroxypyruvate reductase A [Alphaproteobacteria bacterium]
MAIVFMAEIEDHGEWVRRFRAALPEEELRVFPEVGAAAAIDCAIIAKPPPGELAKLSGLKLVCSLWAGVDGLLRDPTFPRHVQLARLVDPYMTQAMSESVLAHVLGAHRQLHTYRAQQVAGDWILLPQPRAHDRRVGILGLGALGSDAAQKLAALGFQVAGWSRNPKTVPGVESFAGLDRLAAFLARTEILVCLIPLTAETTGLMNAQAFAALPKGAFVINLARGQLIVDRDLLAALDGGHLSGAVLDVFHTEPLPADHPYWRHPRVQITPHVAAISDMRSVVDVVAGNIRSFRAGQPVRNLVDLTAGY